MPLTRNSPRRASARIAELSRPRKTETCLDGLRESIYFHEIQTRENLGQRLQIPLAVLIAVAGLMGQLLQNMERGQTGNWVVAFWVAVSGCAVMLGAGFFFFVRSGWGHTYQYLPSAGEMEKYRKNLFSILRSK